MVQNIVIPVNVSSEIMVALNETKQELKNYFQIGIAIMLFQEEKLTIGKAVQLSGVSRYEFEKELTKRNIPISNPSLNDVFSDLEELRDL